MTPCRDWTKIVCFSCGKLGHRVGRQLDETFPYIWPGWSADGRGLYDDIATCRSEAPPGRKRATDTGGGGGGSAARISNELRTPDTGGGVRLTTSRTKSLGPRRILMITGELMKNMFVFS